MADDRDEDAIWQTVIDRHVGYWMRDLPLLESIFIHTPDLRWWSHVGTSAMVTNGWEAFRRTLLIDLASDPDRNPFFAYRARFLDRTIRIWGDAAMVTVTCVFPTGDLPGFHGPETSHDMLLLERAGDRWLIAASVILDDQMGQTEVPMWQIDRTGLVLRRNPAATRYVEDQPESELRLRTGHLHLGSAEADRRLQRAINDVAAAEWGGVMATTLAIPIVFDPGNDLPASVWWVGRKGAVLYVALNDPSLIAGRVERAAAAFGLSPSQRRLTASIVAGVTLTDAARLEGVRISTARTQLQRIFLKVGVRTQPSLVRALLAVSHPG